MRYALRMQAACVFCVNYSHHCLPCPEGIEIGWVIWDLDQIPARGIEQIKEWYAGFPVKASAAPRSVGSRVRGVRGALPV